MRGFCIQKGHSGREVTAIVSAAEWLGVGIKWSREAVEGMVPVGTVEFCEVAFGEHRKDFFPEFLSGEMGRRHYRTSRRIELSDPAFLKDATKWKSGFESRVVYPGELISRKDFWVIEPVEFVQEWRYYVADGGVVTTGWYMGVDEDEPAPELGIEWPEGFSGAVDFGRLADGRIVLVECHAPLACGWYGEDHRD